MSKKLKTAIVGGAIALLVGFAVSYGLIDQQTGNEIKTKSEEILADDGTTAPAPAPDTSTAPAGETAPQAPAPQEATPPTDEAGSVDEAVTQEAPAAAEATPPAEEATTEPASPEPTAAEPTDPAEPAPTQ